MERGRSGRSVHQRSAIVPFGAAAVMVVLAISLAVVSRAVTLSIDPADTARDAATAPVVGMTQPSDSTVQGSRLTPTRAADPRAADPGAADPGAPVVLGVIHEPDVSLAAVDAALDAAATGVVDGASPGGVDQPQAMAAPSPAPRSGASIPTARWVWALLTLGVAAAVLLTTAARGVTPVRSGHDPIRSRRAAAR